MASEDLIHYALLAELIRKGVFIPSWDVKVQKKIFIDVYNHFKNNYIHINNILIIKALENILKLDYSKKDFRLAITGAFGSPNYPIVEFFDK